MKGFAIVVAITLLLVCSANADDFFDRYPSLAKSAGVQKLSPQERASMASLIEAMIEVASSAPKESCENRVNRSCEKAMKRCQEVCLGNTVWDYEAGAYRNNTNLGYICLESCRSAKNGCEQ